MVAFGSLGGIAARTTGTGWGSTTTVLGVGSTTTGPCGVPSTCGAGGTTGGGGVTFISCSVAAGPCARALTELIKTRPSAQDKELAPRPNAASLEGFTVI